MNNLKIGIVGYGNLGRGVESAVGSSPDMELCALFTRRAPESIKTKSGVPVYHIDHALSMKNKLDVLILCGGSANDLPSQAPFFAEHFNIVDSFDTHANIPSHFEKTDSKSRSGGFVSIISAGWDPGMFSLNRLYGEAILPNGRDYTFWGRGVSQGHSDAIRRIPGVLDARQYTIPVEDSLTKVREGLQPDLTTREKHTRECFVVAEDGADLKEIENAIKTMPNYFADYDTTVHFISHDELIKNHSEIPHGGRVFRCGSTNNGKNSHIIEYSLKLDSNPEFTASVLVAFARAAARLHREGVSGAKTVFDIAPSYLHPSDGADLRKRLL